MFTIIKYYCCILYSLHVHNLICKQQESTFQINTKKLLLGPIEKNLDKGLSQDIFVILPIFIHDSVEIGGRRSVMV